MKNLSLIILLTMLAFQAEGAPEGEYARVIVELDNSSIVLNDVQELGRSLKAQNAHVKQRQQAFMAKHNLPPQRAKRFKYLPLMVVVADRATISEIAASTDVSGIWIDEENRPTLLSSLPSIEANFAHADGWTGAGFDIAILDTGVETSHEMLVGNVVQETAACFSNPAYSFETSLCPPGLPACVDDRGNTISDSACGIGAAEPCNSGACGHGTHVAGIAAGNGRLKGVAPDAGIIPVNIFVGRDQDRNGVIEAVVTYDSDIIHGLEHVLSLAQTRSIAAVNISVGGAFYTSTLECDTRKRPIKNAIDALRSVGIATVVSAGNNGRSGGLSSPACISSAISVGSTNDSGDISGFSNESAAMTLSAPGENITSAYPGNRLVTLGGTSMAAPHVAGAIALLHQKAAFLHGE